MKNTIRHDNRPRRQWRLEVFRSASDSHQPLDHIGAILKPMLCGNKKELPPSQTGEHERNHINRHVNAAMPRARFLAFRHPIVLQNEIAGQMCKYPVHFFLSVPFGVIDRKCDNIPEELKLPTHSHKWQNAKPGFRINLKAKTAGILFQYGKIIVIDVFMIVGIDDMKKSSNLPA